MKSIKIICFIDDTRTAATDINHISYSNYLNGMYTKKNNRLIYTEQILF